MAQKITHSLTIYLIKDWITNYEYILNTGKLDIKNDYKEISWIWKVYYIKIPAKTPKWTSFFWKESFSDIFSQSASWIFLQEVNWRTFALTFWPSWRFLLNKWVYEERFWLIVTLNSVNKESLRSLDLVNLESDGLNKRIQSIKPNTSENFWLDIEKDLVRAITWDSKDPTKYWTILSWKEALHTRIKLDISELKSFLNWLLLQFKDVSYKENFPWIENLSEVTEELKINELKWKLLEEFNKTETENLYLTIPDIIEWEWHWWFSYKTWKGKEIYDIVTIEDFKKSLNKDILDIDDFNKNQIYQYIDWEKLPKDHWKIYNCIYFEFTDTAEKKTYLLTSWKWFAVSTTLIDEVENYYNSLCIIKSSCPSKWPCTIDTLCNGYKLNVINFWSSHTDENSYNTDFSDKNTALCLDKKLIKIKWHSTFEVCDIYTKNKEFIHVKKYYWSSSLSHLFAQWYVSWKMLFDSKIRNDVNNLIKSEAVLQKRTLTDFEIKDLTKKPNEWFSKEYTIIFGIIKQNKKTLNIPFFSKLTLMHYSKELINLWYRVCLMQIIDINIKTWKTITP